MDFDVPNFSINTVLNAHDLISYRKTSEIDLNHN